MLLNLIFTFTEIYKPIKMKIYTWWQLEKLIKYRKIEEINRVIKKEKRIEK